MAPKRNRGTGGITWLDNRRARLRVRVDGKVRSKVIHTSNKAHGGRGEAAEALDAFIAEIDREKANDGREGARKTVRMLMDDYTTHCADTGRRPGTVENYEMTTKRLTEELANLPLVDVGPHDLDVFYASLRNDRKIRPNSVRQTHAILRAAFNQAVKWQWIETNPVVSASPPAREAPDHKPLAASDVARLIVAAGATKAEGGDEDVVLAMGIALAALTGARRGELVGIRWDDVDVEAKTIRIERQWVPGKGGQHLADPKSADGKRTVYVGDEGIAMIERYRGLLGELTDHDPFGWMLSPEGTEKPMRAKLLALHITELGGKLDPPIKVTTHAFRRMAATELIAAGIDVDTAARRMGHTREVMFGSYVLGSEDRAIAAGGTLEARLSGQGLSLAELLPYQPKES